MLPASSRLRNPNLRGQYPQMLKRAAKLHEIGRKSSGAK